MRQGSQTKKITDLCDGTRTCREIASLVGRSTSYVYSVVRQQGRRGDLRYLYKSCSPRESRHTLVFRDEVNAWIRAQTPEGAIPADVLIAIIEDAFLDEQESRA